LPFFRAASFTISYAGITQIRFKGSRFTLLSAHNGELPYAATIPGRNALIKLEGKRPRRTPGRGPLQFDCGFEPVFVG